MLNRDYKEFGPGVISHVFNRGNNKETIFYDEQDYRAFLFRLGLVLGLEKDELNKNEITASPKSRIRISKSKPEQFKLHAFCLMPNHFHLLIEQLSDISVSKLIQKVCTSFSRYLNKKYKKVGHIFQDKFKAVRVQGNPQLMWVSAYIHMNPVKDKLVERPEEYRWSSYNDFVNFRNAPIVSKNFLIETFGSLENFSAQTLNFHYAKDRL